MKPEAYITPLIRKWWLLTAAVLVAVASSYFATRNQPPVYQARATLIVGQTIDNPNPTGSDIYLTQQLASTYADIAQREPMHAAVTSALGLPWLPSYNVRSVPNTQLIEVVVADSNPQRAQVVANEVSRQMIRMSPTGSNPDAQSRQAFINQQLDELEAGIKETKDQIAKKQAELTGMFSARQIADTQQQITALQGKLTSLQNNYGVLMQSTPRGSTNTLSVIEPAALPTVPIGPNKNSTIMLAAAIGFVLAALAAYLLNYLDDTLKNPDDVQNQIELTTLGLIPTIKGCRTSEGPLQDCPPAAMEPYNSLRTNLQFAAIEAPLRALLVTSSVPGEGKSWTTAQLAVAFAQSEQRVIVVDGDLRRPQLHVLFGVRNAAGLTSTLLQNGQNLDDVLQETRFPGLRVLTAGPSAPNPTALLGSARMRELMAALRQRADVVIVDSPPASAFADAAILSAQVDGTLLVLYAGKTRHVVARRALHSLNRAHARIVGAALNCVPLRSTPYYSYQYITPPSAGLKVSSNGNSAASQTTVEPASHAAGNGAQ